MALLNSSSYGSLANVSSGQRERFIGKFLPVFITGEMRKNQEIGKLQCMAEIGGNDYIYHNESEMYFIPLFIKRVWEKYIPAQNQKGEKYDQLVGFGGWNDEPKADDDCRYVYYIAGLGLDKDTKKVKLHEKDIENNKTKSGDKVLIYFRCASTKYQGAMDLMDSLSKKIKDIPPLSDNIEFERNVVAPRRFIVKTSIGMQETKFGNKSVFSFDPMQMLPDKMVETIMNLSMELTPDFEKQFKESKENQIRKPSQSSSSDNVDSSKLTFEDTSKKDESKESAKIEEESTPSDDFNLGI